MPDKIPPILADPEPRPILSGLKKLRVIVVNSQLVDSVEMIYCYRNPEVYSSTTYKTTICQAGFDKDVPTTAKTVEICSDKSTKLLIHVNFQP